MVLDVNTLLFALLLTFCIQAIAFFLITVSIIKYNGTKYWALSELIIVLSFATLFFRSKGVEYDLLIVASNSFQILGLLFFYIGSKRFFKLKSKNYLPIAGSILSLLIIGYFTYIDFQLNARIIALSVSIAIFSFFTGWIFISQSKNAYRKASVFVACLFFLNFFFFTSRGLYHLFEDRMDGLIGVNSIQTITLIFSICFALMWMLSIIVVIIQRLYSELKDSINVFELIFNTIPEGIAISTNHSLQFISTNPSFSRLTGYNKEEALESPNFVSKFWASPKSRLRLIEELDKKGFYNNQEAIIQHKDGSKRVGLFSSTRITINENKYILTIGRDITDLKAKEQELAQKTRILEEMVAEKDKFFTILAHDLRGPIATALSLTELMINKSNEFTKEDLIKFTNALNRSIGSTNELLDNLLEWSGARRGMITFIRQEISISDLMSQVLPYLMENARCKNISIKDNIPAEISVYADRHITQTIFRNLIINAIKFTHHGGEIKLSAYKNEKKQVIFSISDSGIGMSESILSTLFRLGANNNRPGTNGEASSGLGLLLCKEFVEKHGGKIWAESEVDKGSTFSFTLDPE